MTFWSVNSAFQTSEARLKKKLKFLIGSRLLGRATPILLPDPPDQSSGPLLKLKKKPKTTECSTPRNKTDDPLPEFVSTLVDRDQADPGLPK